MKAAKKIVKILPWVLAVIAIAAAVTVFVYAGKAEMNYDGEAEVAELQENIVSLQSRVDDLKDQIDSKYFDDELRGEMKYTAEELEELIDAMPSNDPNAIDVIAKELFDQAESCIGNIWFNGTEFLPFISPYEENPELEVTIDGRTYSKCDMLYSDFVEVYSGIFTGEALNDFLNWKFTDVDGYLYAIFSGGMTGVGVEDVKLTRVSEKGDEITYNISYNYVFIQGNEQAATCSMTIKPVNGIYKISEFDYRNIKAYWND